MMILRKLKDVHYNKVGFWNQENMENYKGEIIPNIIYMQLYFGYEF